MQTELTELRNLVDYQLDIYKLNVKIKNQNLKKHLNNKKDDEDSDDCSNLGESKIEHDLANSNYDSSMISLH